MGKCEEWRIELQEKDLLGSYNLGGQALVEGNFIILQYSHFEFRHIHLDSYVAVVLTRAGYLHGTLSLMESEVVECYYVQTALPVWVR